MTESTTGPSGAHADAFERFKRASALVDEVVARIRPEQLGEPTPCTEWNVRELLTHVVANEFAFAGWAEAGGGHPDTGAYVLPDDYVAAYREGARRVTAAFEAPGMAERTYQTPIGEGPGVFLVELLFNDMLLHGWDLARATGQSTDFPEDLVASSRAALGQAPRVEGGPFAAAQPEPESGTAADRLAAFAGRVAS